LFFCIVIYHSDNFKILDKNNMELLLYFSTPKLIFV
jgi:hypothetical protein